MITTSLCRGTGAVLMLLLAACTNYEFARARNAAGDLDVPKLIADLEQSGRTQLQEGLWIPFLYTTLTTFGKNAATLPDGYTIQHLKSFGPFALAGSSAQQILDGTGAGIESWDREWVGWGLLYRNRDNFVETTHGRRHEKHERMLSLFGSDGTTYTPYAQQPQ